MNELSLDRILDAIRSAAGQWLVYIVAAVIVISILLIVWKIVARRRRGAPPPTPELAIDLDSLGTQGPPPAGPVLEHYNVPVRLAAVVLAPTGRVLGLPALGQISELIDHVVPGLGQVVAAHHPVIRRWPSQLSAEGFAHTFFTQVRLPGDGGKGTPWCSVAGRFKIQRQSLMAGLVMRAAVENNFGRTIIHQEHEWLGILRVKSA